MDHAGMATADGDGRVDWFADALILPDGSDWDTSVRIQGSDGTELSRQRFAFSLDADGIADGRVRDDVNPASAAALALLVGGALGIGLGVGGFTIPRTERIASRVALVGGGIGGVVLGALIGITRLAG
jgi:hypothetical protein